MLDPLDLSQSHLALLANSAAGNKDTARDIAEIRDRLTPQLRRFSLFQPEKSGSITDAARRAVQSGADILAVLGGDGTQSAVAGVLAGADVVMAVLPGGTFNYFSREIGSGETLEEALSVLEAGEVTTIDLGEVNGRVFLNNASFGVYPAILEKRETIYGRWGRSRFMAYWSVILALTDLRDPMRLQVTTGAQTREVVTALAFAARSPYQVESFGLEGGEAIRDGHFALFIAQGHRRRDLAMAAARLALGKAARGRDFEMVIADDIVINSSRKHRLLAFDGEKAKMAGPWHLKIRKNALRVITAGTDRDVEPLPDEPGTLAP